MKTGNTQEGVDGTVGTVMTPSKKANQVQLPQFASCINALAQNIDVYGGFEFLNISKFDNAINENITKYNWCS